MNIFEVSLTNYCNFKCTYCISDGSRGNDKFSLPLKTNLDGSLKIHPEGMLQADYDRLKDTAHDSGDWLDLPKLLSFITSKMDGDWVVNLTGGEPLYYPGIDDFIFELSKTNRVVVTSNVSLIRNHKKLLEVNRDSIFFRVGYHPEFRKEHEFISNMKYLIENGFKYIINYVLHPSYYIDSSKFSEHIQLLEDNGFIYEITPFEGKYNEVTYPRPKLKQHPTEKSLLSSHQLKELPRSPMGNHFLLAEPNGKIFECQGKSANLGDIYKNHLLLVHQPMRRCFNDTGCSPSKSANNYLKLFLNSELTTDFT